MTYTYTDGDKTVTNVYNARDSYTINKFIAKFTPSIVKKETSGNEQHKAFVMADMTTNPLNISNSTAKCAGIR